MRDKIFENHNISNSSLCELCRVLKAVPFDNKSKLTSSYSNLFPVCPCSKLTCCIWAHNVQQIKWLFLRHWLLKRRNIQALLAIQSYVLVVAVSQKCNFMTFQSDSRNNASHQHAIRQQRCKEALFKEAEIQSVVLRRVKWLAEAPPPATGALFAWVVPYPLPLNEAELQNITDSTDKLRKG